MDKLRALVIDDNAQTRTFLIEKVLKPYGLEPLVAINGAEGLRKALACSPHLIIMAFEISRLTALEVLRELRRRNSQVPVIMMTSHRSEQIAVEIFHLRVNDYVMKPFTTDVMHQAIDKALYITRLRREKEGLQIQLKQLQQQSEQNVHQLDALYFISKSITGLVPPAQLLERIVETVLFVTRSEECVLSLIDPELGQLEGQLSRRRPADQSVPEPPPAGANGTEMPSGPLPSESVLAVPLQVGQKVVGTLSITKQVTGQFTWQDDRLLRILADYAAMAIYNAQLGSRYKKRKVRHPSGASS